MTIDDTTTGSGSSVWDNIVQFFSLAPDALAAEDLIFFNNPSNDPAVAAAVQDSTNGTSNLLTGTNLPINNLATSDDPVGAQMAASIKKAATALLPDMSTVVVVVIVLVLLILLLGKVEAL